MGDEALWLAYPLLPWLECSFHYFQPRLQRLDHWVRSCCPEDLRSDKLVSSCKFLYCQSHVQYRVLILSSVPSATSRHRQKLPQDYFLHAKSRSGGLTEEIFCQYMPYCSQTARDLPSLPYRHCKQAACSLIFLPMGIKKDKSKVCG